MYGHLSESDEESSIKLAEIAEMFSSAISAVGVVEDLITQLGHDQGQLDLWMSLSVGDKIPPGYTSESGNQLVSYEMLSAQRDNWRLARDRTFETLVEAGYVFYEKLLILLLAMNDYLIAIESPNRELMIDYRNKIDPLVKTAEEIFKITGERLGNILKDYRDALKRYDLGLDKMDIPPLEIPKESELLFYLAIAIGGFVLAKSL